MKEKKRDIVFLRWLPLLLICTYVVFPIYWAVNTAFKEESEILGKSVTYLPKNGTVANFVDAWTNVGFDKYFFNSLKVSGISVIFIVIISIMVGYALSRYKFKFKMAFLGLLLAVQFIPAAVLLVPLFNIFNGVGLVGSHIALILVNVTFQTPFCCVMMRGFVEGVPYALEEAAMIDGCSRIRGIFKVVIPMLVPGIVTVAAFALIGCWNEFLFAMMFLNDPNKYTVPIGLKMMQGEYGIHYGAMAAGAIIAMAIPVLLFAYIQKYLVTGLSAGAVKG
ncbi:MULTISPECIES: carbohydrate ABC transporter permease [Lachnospiraceae]|uniref:Carbohydrate ABC transporter permease n=1 Tax=Faecalicatena acetigenes TaxID=2981790 RepID=A0ABT2TA40_9FIRM|nr:MULTISPECIES: carbohydrate ABC transporter permease [Lachnospiraceae]MCU6747130.1 carbohydrate ABC transporter permease [Faecalicatena acetigenes]SCH67192.1 Inner membrane ABC transporter permease protein ycjP [uncultured Clostridium sp.]